MAGKSCPNCSAPITSEKCPYCGTVFVDFAVMTIDKPFWIKVKAGDSKFMAEVLMPSISIEASTTKPMTISAEFTCLSIKGVG